MQLIEYLAVEKRYLISEKIRIKVMFEPGNLSHLIKNVIKLSLHIMFKYREQFQNYCCLVGFEFII